MFAKYPRVLQVAKHLLSPCCAVYLGAKVRQDFTPTIEGNDTFGLIMVFILHDWNVLIRPKPCMYKLCSKANDWVLADNCLFHVSSIIFVSILRSW